MNAFKRILVVFSRDTCDQAALDLAASLVNDNEAQVTVVEVIEGLPSDVRRTIAIMRPLFLEQPEESLLREKQKQLAQSVESIRERGIQGDTKVLIGVPFRVIAEEVLRNEYDLLILTVDRRGSWRDRLFGGTAIARCFNGSIVERVLRCTPCPVLIVHPEHPVTGITGPRQMKAESGVS